MGGYPTDEKLANIQLAKIGEYPTSSKWVDIQLTINGWIYN